MILFVFITVISGHDKPQPPGCLLGQRLRRASGRCGPAAPWYFLSPLPCPVGHYMNVTVCI
ncbi:hypothetical protein C9069_24730 (plasmid) [Escherichia coli]|nr:hypothetical protein C9069_24730 [Escherichia coli]